MGNFFGDELFTDLLSVNVVRPFSSHEKPHLPGTSKTTSMVHSMAQFWQTVAAVIELHTDKGVWPARWTPHARYENLNLTAAMAYATSPPSDVRGDRVHMIVLPDCPDLYEYTTFTTLLAAVEFSKELCLHLGRHFTLTAFHPHFKNSPTLMSPERHSPFPTIGLQFPRRGNALIGQDADLPLHGRQWAQTHQPLEQSKTNDNGKILPHPEGPPEDEEIGALADARIRNLDETRNSLEVLFNSAAAAERAKGMTEGSSFPAPTSSEQAAKARSTTAASLDYFPSKNNNNNKEEQTTEVPLSEEEQLARTFRQERQRRRGDLPPEMVRQVVALWMDEQRYADASKRQLNPALEFMDTLDGYTVCSQKVGELVYAEIWQAIQQVYEKGLLVDAQAPSPPDVHQANMSAKKTPEKNKNHFDLSSWMHSLSNEQNASANKNNANEELPQVTSSLFIATKFNKYNAQNEQKATY